MTPQIRTVCRAAVLATCTFFAGAALSADYPERAIELVVPWAAGGGTDSMARAFAEAARKHLNQSIVITNKPGATGSIGFTDVAKAAPDGYKVSVLTAEILIIPHMGIGRITHDDFIPIARFNALPSAITVRADAPWNTVEEFLAQARREPGTIKVGNSGVGSIWHLAAAALGDKASAQFNHIPFQGGNPAVLALLGGHVDAVSVSTAEVLSYVATRRLKTLAVMAEKRVKGFDSVPTLKERNIDLSVGSWAGLGALKGTPAKVIETLKAATVKAMAEPVLIEAMEKMNLNAAYADDATFKVQMARDSDVFKGLVEKLQLKNQA